MTGVVEIAARCEQATGPDRELDAEIATAIGWTGVSRVGHGHVGHCPDRFFGAVPRYTTSLDAAMSLVPEGWERFDVDATAPELGIDWTLHGPERRKAKGTAATPALALTAACLKARAQKESGK